MATSSCGFIACCLFLLCAGSLGFQKELATAKVPAKESENWLAHSDQWLTGVKTVPLRRERVSVYNKGQHISYRTSYSGAMSIGEPAQEFRVLFDTGSNHVIVPSSQCMSESCVVHNRYNMSESLSAVSVNMRSKLLAQGHLPRPKTDIYFGTGKITGEFARERVCTGPMCLNMDMVHAIDMSVQPFKSFQFDGIVGLGPVMHQFGDKFSMLLMMQESGAPNTQFSMFLTENEKGEGSEISFGGSVESRYKGPMQWVNTIMPEHGHWLIRVKAFKVNGVAFGDCEKCNFQTNENCCHGIVDTGTSHLGIPMQIHKEVNSLLTLPYTPAANSEHGDCRDVEGPKIEFEFFENFSIDVHTETYVRRIPLPVGADMLKSKGISMAGIPGVDGAPAKTEPASSITPTPDSASEPPKPTPPEEAVALLQTNLTKPATPEEPVALLQTNLTIKADASASADVSTAVAQVPAESQPMECTSRLMSVDLPAPLGPYLFLLGEPVVQRYYTVYDWGKAQIGFAQAVNRINTLRDAHGQPDVDDGIVLMQIELKVHTRRGRSSSSAKALPAPVSSATDPCSEPVDAELSVMLEFDLYF